MFREDRGFIFSGRSGKKEGRNLKNPVFPYARGNGTSKGIRLNGVYDTPDAADRYRILIKRLWPRGISKEQARAALRVKDAGAGTPLRTWFAHDPREWEEYRSGYF